MARSLNILHLLLALSAWACIHFAWQDTKDKIVELVLATFPIHLTI
jgi:hypothetical protein